MVPALPAGLALACIVLALAAAALVRPWRQLRGGQLATPFLAMLTLLPWLWAWPGPASLPLHWSGAPLAVLLLGWPLAIAVLVVAGLSTLLTTGASLAQALAATVWLGVLPATLLLVLGQAVRAAFGTHPVAYLLGRAFIGSMLALFAGGMLAIAISGLPPGRSQLQVVTTLLLALGEASWTCAVASLLVAWRPRWLATWSDALYLPQPARAPARRPRRSP